MPSPNRRNKGEILAHQISDHSAARGVADDRDRLAATRARQDKKWASLSSVLEQHAEQARTDYELADHLSHFSKDVKQGRAKPPIVALPLKCDKREALEIEVNQRNSAGSFRRVLDVPCPAHGVAPGEPCWWPFDHKALCGGRIQRAGLNGVVTTRARGPRG